LTWKTWKTPGRLLEFYVRPGIFGMISHLSTSSMVKPFGGQGSAPDPSGGAYRAIVYN